MRKCFLSIAFLFPFPYFYIAALLSVDQFHNLMFFIAMISRALFVEIISFQKEISKSNYVFLLPA
jgi:hypothetical protein